MDYWEYLCPSASENKKKIISPSSRSIKKISFINRNSSGLWVKGLRSMMSSYLSQDLELGIQALDNSLTSLGYGTAICFSDLTHCHNEHQIS